MTGWTTLGRTVVWTARLPRCVGGFGRQRGCRRRRLWPAATVPVYIGSIDTSTNGCAGGAIIYNSRLKLASAGVLFGAPAPADLSARPALPLLKMASSCCRYEQLHRRLEWTRQNRAGRHVMVAHDSIGRSSPALKRAVPYPTEWRARTAVARRYHRQPNGLMRASSSADARRF